MAEFLRAVQRPHLCSIGGVLALLRHMVLRCLEFNIWFRARHVPGLSRAVAGGVGGGFGVPPLPVGYPDQRMMSLVQSSVAPTTWAGYGLPVTAFQFRSVLNKTLSFVGANPSEYGTHSFRIGAATEASRAGLRRPHICFLGHSYVFWAAQRAEVRPGGKSLGFREMEVKWRGIRGLKWCQVLPEAISIGQAAPPPVILVIHVGGNDLCVLRVAELITLMRADMERIASYFSEVILVWSEMIPRVTWQGARDAAAVERVRRMVNARLSRFVRSKGWVVVRHRQLEGDNRRLMRADGVHLNEIGLDIFLSGLQDGVEQALFLLGGGSEPSVILWSPPWRYIVKRSGDDMPVGSLTAGIPRHAP
ncbi:uncharacterized protein RB166_001414 [Leptodactylus fuscus]